MPAILEDAELPLHLRHVLASVREEVRAIEARIAALERDLRPSPTPIQSYGACARSPASGS